jgi:hypothetical protein
MTIAMQRAAQGVLPGAQDRPPVWTPATPSTISRAFLGASLAFVFVYLGGVGVITALIPNALFARLVEPTIWSYVFWLAPAGLFGPLAASYVLPNAAVCDVPRAEQSTTVGSVLSFLAVGCPVCNKLVVLALGASGAITYFEPAQPWLGGLSVILLGYAFWARFGLGRIRRHFVMSPSAAASSHDLSE